MNKFLKIGLVGTVVGAMLLTGAVAVFAQGPNDKGGVRIGAMGPMGGRMAPGVRNSEAIAQALGMTAEELQVQLRDGAVLADLADEKGVALQTLRDLAIGEAKASALDRLGEAIQKGDITEAFSNWFKRGVDAGYVLAFDGSRIDSPSVVAAAKALGMSAEEVELQMWGGRTLAQLAERAGVELQQVEAAMAAARKSAATERIQQAVQDGKLSEEQAEWMIEGVESGFDGIGRWGDKGPGRGMIPMMGGMRGGRAPARGFFRGGDCPTVDTSSSTDI